MPIESKCVKLKGRQSNYMVNHFQLHAASSRVLDAKYMGHCCRRVRYCLWKRQRTHTHGKRDKSKREGGADENSCWRLRHNFLKNNCVPLFLLLHQSFIAPHVDHWSLCSAAVTLPSSDKNGSTQNLLFCPWVVTGQPSHNGICPWGVNAWRRCLEVAAGQ